MRLLDAAYRIAASVFAVPPSHVVLVAFQTSGYRWTSWHRPVVWAGETYDPRSLDVDNLSENLLLRAPEGKIGVTSLDGVEQARAVARQFRGDRVAVAFLWHVGGAFHATDWQTLYRIDRENFNGNALELVLLSSDAAEGVSAPLYTTTESGCQLDFRRGACSFRPATKEGAGFPTSDLATKCTRLLDGPLGCAAHFPDIDDVKGLPFNGTLGARLRLPLPYRAFPGSLVRWLGV